MSIGIRGLAGAVASAALGLFGSALAQDAPSPVESGPLRSTPTPQAPNPAQGDLSATGLPSTDQSQVPPFQSGSTIVDSPDGAAEQGGIVTTPGETGTGGSGTAGASECGPAPGHLSR